MGLEVIVYEDLQCGDCAHLRTLLDELMIPSFAGRVLFTHRDFPLPRHDWARQAALLAHYFKQFGLDSSWRRDTLAHHKTLSLSEHLYAFASRHDLDPAAALQAMTDPAVEASLESDISSARERGVSRTPTLFIGSFVLIEPQHADEISDLINKSL